MMKSLMILGLFIMLCGSVSAQTADLMFSEYVEGSGENQALEIFNGTADVVNLGGYFIERYANGQTVVTASVPLPAIDLPAGTVFVLVNSLASTALQAYADMTDPEIVFSGNDALVLTLDGLPVDSIGRVGEDPGNFWFCADGTTQNHSLIRLPGICSGDTTIDDLFDPCLEWQFEAVDIYTNLGTHNDDCGSVPDAATSWGTLKAIFR